MSKQLFVDPREMRAPGKIEFTDILENQYQKTVKDEVGNFPREDLDVYKRQVWIRCCLPTVIRITFPRSA